MSRFTLPSPYREFSGIQQRVDRMVESGMIQMCLKNANAQKRNLNLRMGGHMTKQTSSDQAEETGFKEIKTYLYKKYSLKQMQTGMVVQGLICDRTNDSISVRLQKVWSTDSADIHLENLDKLDIKATVLLCELPPQIGDFKMIYTISSTIKGKILKIDHHTDDVFLTLQGSSSLHQLGTVKETPEEKQRWRRKRTWSEANDRSTEPKFYHPEPQQDEYAYDPAPAVPQELTASSPQITSPAPNVLFAPSPMYMPSPLYQPSPQYHILASPSYSLQGHHLQPPSRIKAPTDPRRERQTENFAEKVKKHPMFRNPAGIDLMKRAYGISNYSSLMTKPKVNKEWKYEILREKQTEEWAQKNLEAGIIHAKAGDFKHALKCYRSCLDVRPDMTDCMVAIGAALAHQSKFEEAEKVITRALEIDPETRNAAQYLEKIKERKNARESGEDPFPAGARRPPKPQLPSSKPNMTGTPPAPDPEMQETWNSVFDQTDSRTKKKLLKYLKKGKKKKKKKKKRKNTLDWS